MPLVILTEDQQVTYTPYMYSSISFVYNVVQHQHFVFSATFKFYLYIDLKSSIYNIEVDLGVASLLDTVIRLNHLWNLYLKVQTWSVIWKKNVTTLCNMIGASPWVTFMTNPSYPNTRIHILHTVLCTLPKVNLLHNQEILLLLIIIFLYPNLYLNVWFRGDIVWRN